jgi:hypothetical protein
MQAAIILAIVLAVIAAVIVPVELIRRPFRSACACVRKWIGLIRQLPGLTRPSRTSPG